MSNSSSRRFPVTVTQLPVTRCEICQRTLAYRPSALNEALTEHYRRAYPEAPGLPALWGLSMPHLAAHVTVPTATARKEPERPRPAECGRFR